MKKQDLRLFTIKDKDKILVSQFITAYWGSSISVSRRKVHHAA
jgi:hypothetical protein